MSATAAPPAAHLVRSPGLPAMPPRTCSIVVSAFNEAPNLPPLLAAIGAAMAGRPEPYEVIFVDDGSSDDSRRTVAELHAADHRVRLVALSRNFGHEAAMLAGLDAATGDVVTCLDADLQHPPAKLPEMLDAMASGFEVVSMVRTDRRGASLIQRALSRGFYWVLNRLSSQRFEPTASDFFMVSRRVADILRTEFRERARFLRGFVQAVGFRRTTIAYVAAARAHGETRYRFWSLLALSVHAIFSFSNVPLRLGIGAGLLSGGASLVLLAYTLAMKFLGTAPSGYTTIVILVTFMFAVQFVLIGIIGEYLGLLFFEAKKRPIYLVEERRFFEAGP